MSRTKKKPATRPLTSSKMERNGPANEVLTLAEAAEYLRLSEPEVVDLVHSQNLQGRLAGRLASYVRHCPSPRSFHDAEVIRLFR